MTHVVTVWLAAGTGPARETFRAAHVAVTPVGDGWIEVVLMDEDWKVTLVEQFRDAHRVSVEVTHG